MQPMKKTTRLISNVICLTKPWMVSQIAKRSSLRANYWQRCTQEVHKARVCRTVCLCQSEINLLALL